MTIDRDRELDVGDACGRLPLVAIANGRELVLSKGQSLAGAANVGRPTAGTGDANGLSAGALQPTMAKNTQKTEVQRRPLPDVSAITSSN